MASMSRHERALSYARRLIAAQDLYAEARAVRNEVDGLIWAENRNPLPLEEKTRILEEVKSIILGGERDQDGRTIVQAGDNSGIIDVITNIERELEEKK